MQYVQMTLNDWMELKGQLEAELRGAAAGFVRIGYLLRKIDETEGYKNDGSKSLAEWAKPAPKVLNPEPKTPEQEKKATEEPRKQAEPPIAPAQKETPPASVNNSENSDSAIGENRQPEIQEEPEQVEIDEILPAPMEKNKEAELKDRFEESLNSLRVMLDAGNYEGMDIVIERLKVLRAKLIRETGGRS